MLGLFDGLKLLDVEDRPGDLVVTAKTLRRVVYSPSCRKRDKPHDPGRFNPVTGRSGQTVVAAVATRGWQIDYKVVSAYCELLCQRVRHQQLPLGLSAQPLLSRAHFAWHKLMGPLSHGSGERTWGLARSAQLAGVSSPARSLSWANELACSAGGCLYSNTDRRRREHGCRCESADTFLLS
jgi:hypothetical protein